MARYVEPWIAQITWDDEHKSPLIGPYRGRAAAVKAQQDFRRSFKEHGLEPLPIAIMPIREFDLLQLGKDKAEEMAAKRPREAFPGFQMHSLYGWWQELKKDDLVAHKGRVRAVYRVVSGDFVWEPPNHVPEYAKGPWIELERSTGTRFMAHVLSVIPREMAPAVETSQQQKVQF